MPRNGFCSYYSFKRGMKKTHVPITTVSPKREYHTEEQPHNLTVDDRMYFQKMSSSRTDHPLYYYTPNYDPPRLPLQMEDEPEFIKVSIPTSSLPRSPQRKAHQQRLNQDVALQNHLDSNNKHGPFTRRPRPDSGAALRAHLSNEEESYYDQTTTFSDYQNNLVTKELLERQAQHRYQLQYLNKTKGPNTKVKHVNDSPYPNL